MKTWFKERLKEPSTYRGLALALGAAGVYIDPTALEAVIMGVFGIVGAIEAGRKES